MTIKSLNLVPLRSSDKVEQLITVLQDRIIDGDLKPGTPLPAERYLAAQLNVSRFSLREALRVAQAKGLIEITRGRPPRVAQVSSAAVADLMGINLRRLENSLLELVEARQALECNIARCAALKAEPSHIDAMRQTIEDMKNNQDDLAFCIEKDIAFHNILIKASGNRVFEIMLSPLSAALRKSRKKTMMQFIGVKRAINGHEEILAAITAKDAEKADVAMHHHLTMAEEDLKKVKED
jgi:GntR family transcriptional regulator, transcriptional repressor for pyruvate dehydrogenase complex